MAGRGFDGHVDAQAVCRLPERVAANGPARHTDACAVRVSPAMGLAAALPGKTFDSSRDSDMPRCAASTPLNTERKSVVACTSRLW